MAHANPSIAHTFKHPFSYLLQARDIKSTVTSSSFIASSGINSNKIIMLK